MLRLLQEKGSNVPVFVARDLSRLPPITFDSVDVSSLILSIRRAQLEIDQLKACVGGQRDATVDLTDVVKAVDRRLTAVETDHLVASRLSAVETDHLVASRLSAVETDHLVASAVPVSVVGTEPPVVAVTDKQEDVNGDAISCAAVLDSIPLDGSQWPILAANPVSTPSASTRQPVDVPKWTTVVRRSAENSACCRAAIYDYT